MAAPPVIRATRLRLASGLVLVAFAATHLANHSLGLISLEAMEQGREVFLGLWRSLPGTVLLYTALVTHVGLGLARLYARRSLRMPAWEMLQITLGLLIPFWLVVHVLGTRGAHEINGTTDSYAYLLDLLWPGGMLQQATLLLLVWVHGCIGVHFWLRIRPWYRHVRGPLFALALLLPTLALAGFVDAAQDLAARIRAEPAWRIALADAQAWPTAAERGWIYRTEGYVLNGFLGVLLGLAGVRAVRAVRARKGGRIRVRYPDGSLVAIRPGTSVLEASRSAGIPHASVCGGRGRCSTCRVRILEGADRLPPASADEARVLSRIGAGDGVRLACQLRPGADLAIVPLLPASAGPREAGVQVSPGQGVEREVAVLFADLRAFTRLAEGRLPYDVVFVLNQYFKAMGEAIEREGGHVDKFIGDGIMALFGIADPPALACRRALAAARAMADALEQLNRRLGHDLPEPLRVGIGLHAGPVILGEMGYGRATSLTAIGDAVNVASRLEALTKALEVQLVVSAALAEQAGVDLSAFELRETLIRGRRRPLRLRLVPDARSLPLPPGEMPDGHTLARPWWNVTVWRRRRLDGRLSRPSLH